HRANRPHEMPPSFSAGTLPPHARRRSSCTLRALPAHYRGPQRAGAGGGRPRSRANVRRPQTVRPGGSMARLSLALLGGFHAGRAPTGGPLTLTRGKARALLAYLAL